MLYYSNNGYSDIVRRWNFKFVLANDDEIVGHASCLFVVGGLIDKEDKLTMNSLNKTYNTWEVVLKESLCLLEQKFDMQTTKQFSSQLLQEVEHQFIVA